MAELADLADRFENAAQAIIGFSPEITGRRWSLAERFGTEPEASWGPPEVLAHVTEMVPYWLGEIERIVEAPAGSAPIPFGRVADDDVRIAIIARDRTIPTRELLARLDSESRRVAARIRKLAAMTPSVHGLHPRRGEMDLPSIVERFLATHTEEHVTQLREILDRAA